MFNFNTKNIILIYVSAPFCSKNKFKTQTKRRNKTKTKTNKKKLITTNVSINAYAPLRRFHFGRITNDERRPFLLSLNDAPFYCLSLTNETGIVRRRQRENIEVRNN